MSFQKNDRTGYNELYKKKRSGLVQATNPVEYVNLFECWNLSPYYSGGNTKGFVRSLATERLKTTLDKRGVPTNELTVLDAGCGQGELSVYLGCLGYNVVGVDISAEGCRAAEEMARNVGVADRCQFVAESLEKIPLENESIDCVIGHASLHHFIKYDGVVTEFMRVMRGGSEGYFADSFGENKLYHLFHDKERMERLGDVILTKELVTSFFKDFEVELVPADWFTMLDKLYGKFAPKRIDPFIRKISRLHFALDRLVPTGSRISLYLSGSVMTAIKKPATI